MNPRRDVPVDPYFLDDPPFEPDYHRAIAQNVGLPFYVDVPWPEDIPGDAQERTVDLAERILGAGGARTGFGHHEAIRQSMADWVPGRDEDCAEDPGFWRRCVFTIVEGELGPFGRPTHQPLCGGSLPWYWGRCVHGPFPLLGPNSKDLNGTSGGVREGSGTHYFI
jgi:hypothetical protein